MCKIGFQIIGGYREIQSKFWHQKFHLSEEINPYISQYNERQNEINSVKEVEQNILETQKNCGNMEFRVARPLKGIQSHSPKAT